MRYIESLTFCRIQTHLGCHATVQSCKQDKSSYKSRQSAAETLATTLSLYTVISSAKTFKVLRSATMHVVVWPCNMPCVLLECFACYMYSCIQKSCMDSAQTITLCMIHENIQA